MSCMWCKHFSREISDDDRKLKGLPYLELPGACTLNPQRIEVSGNHYCAQFLIGPNFYGEGGTLLAQWWLDHKASHDRAEELRLEVKRLKETNRKLRDKLKGRDDVTCADAARPITKPNIEN